MERSGIAPHISWSGPQPEREVDAYLLAMLLRIHASGLDFADESTRDHMAQPSVLTTKNLRVVAIMFAYYQARMEEAGARNTEKMLQLVRDCAEDSVAKWLKDNAEAVRKAEAELIEYVETPGGSPGFTAFG